MLSVAIHKDIAEYQPKVIGKLTGRTLISITVALGLSISVAVYMNLVLKITLSSSMRFHCPVGAVAFGSLTGCHSSNLLSFGYSTSSPIIDFFTNRQCLRAGS